MRLDRFSRLLTSVLAANPDPAIVAHHHDTESGDRRIEFTTGAVVVHFVRSSPPGGDKYDQPEKVVEAQAPLPTVPVPAIIQADDRVRVGSIRAWLIAALTNSGSREITSVAEPTGHSREKGYGLVNVRFASGAACHGSLVHTLRRGETPTSNNRYQIADVI